MKARKGKGHLASAGQLRQQCVLSKKLGVEHRGPNNVLDPAAVYGLSCLSLERRSQLARSQAASCSLGNDLLPWNARNSLPIPAARSL